MFKFDFGIEDDSAEHIKDEVGDVAEGSVESLVDERPFREHTLAGLVQNLPDDISYSSVRIGDLYIPRRDLFDVRLQLMASEGQNETTPNEAVRSDETENQAAIEFASRPSDLVPRVYEGGMKTWECSLDLAGYVTGEQSNIGDLRGKKILELGCGTAMPTLAILKKLFDSPVTPDISETVIHLQDYNTSVLEYVTVPNIILVWFFSKAGDAYRNTIPPPSPKPAAKTKTPDVAHLTLQSVPEEDEDEIDVVELPTEDQTLSLEPHVFDLKEPGDLALTPSLRSAFLESLAAHRIETRLFSGPWDGFDVQRLLGSRPEHASYDLVLTSETIYQPSSLPSLVGLLHKATGSSGTCLVAAKMVYFGVGGGIREFEQALNVEGGYMQSVWELREGVGRSILNVDFGNH